MLKTVTPGPNHNKPAVTHLQTKPTRHCSTLMVDGHQTCIAEKLAPEQGRFKVLLYLAIALLPLLRHLVPRLGPGRPWLRQFHSTRNCHFPQNGHKRLLSSQGSNLKWTCQSTIHRLTEQEVARLQRPDGHQTCIAENASSPASLI